MKFADLVKTDEYGVVALRFESHWKLEGQYTYHNKANCFINWIFGKWNSGELSLNQLKYLINVELASE